MITRMRHDVKSWPDFFGPIVEGRRTHELRRNDRGYAVGDRMLLREFDPRIQQYTGRTATVEITSLTSGENPCAVSDQGLHPDFCILSVRLVT